jgi:hypothetical protein
MIIKADAGEAAMQAMANLLRVRSMVQQTLARQDAERTNQFLYAASQGDVAKIRQVSLQYITIFSQNVRPRNVYMAPMYASYACLNATTNEDTHLRHGRLLLAP